MARFIDKTLTGKTKKTICSLDSTVLESDTDEDHTLVKQIDQSTGNMDVENVCIIHHQSPLYTQYH